MKKVLFLVVLMFAFVSANNTLILKKFEGTYNGLTKNMEYQFTDNDGEIYIFYEVSDDVKYDLNDEDYIGQKFIVTWTTKTIEQYDENDEPVEIEVKVITGLKKV